MANVTNLDEKREEASGSVIKKSRYNRKAYDPGSQLRELECFSKIDEMVRNGAYVRDVVSVIHGGGEMTHMSRNAVSHVVSRYKDYVFSDEGVYDSESGSSSDVDKDDPMAIVNTLKEQFFAMNERIKMETETEKSLSKLFSTTHKEYLASSMLGERIMKRLESHGLLDLERGSSEQRVGSGTPGRTDLAKAVTDPETRHQVLGLIDLMFAHPDVLDGISALDSIRKKTRKYRPKRKRKNKKRSQSED